MSGQFLLLPSFREITVLKANCVDTDQTPRSAASDLGLRCLPMSLLWCTRHKWVKACIINVKKIAFGNKEHTTDWKMGVSLVSSLLICNCPFFFSSCVLNIVTFTKV